MNKVKLTMLNEMGGWDFAASLEKHKEWNIKALDLKNGILGKEIIALSDDEAELAAKMIEEKGLSVYCFSTVLYNEDIEIGEEEFRKRSLDKIDRILDIAHILRPQVIRLLAASSRRRKEFSNIMPYIHSNFPWLIPLYKEAIEKINENGFGVTIENEVGNCIFSKPEEILEFFDQLDCPGKVSFTYDIQNLWQMGTFPSVESYRKLSGITGYFHLKGGQSDGGSELVWGSALEDASWPVKDIISLAINDNISSYFCLNPSHGKAREGELQEEITKMDIAFLRRTFDGIE